MNMKKIIGYFAIAVAAVLALSCQKDNLERKAEEATVNFSVAIPGEAGTKAAYGETVAFTPELHVAVYLGENNLNGTPGKYLPDVKPVITRINNTEWEVTITLVKNYDYDIVFWAQKDEAPYGLDWEKGTITAKYNVPANDITRDAFYYLCEDYNCIKYASTPYQIELRRPFAQINMGASDYSALVELYEALDKTESDLQTTIKSQNQVSTLAMAIPSVLHVLTGVADTPASVEFSLAATTVKDGYDLTAPENDIVVTGTDDAGNQVSQNYTLVGTNYVFANVAKAENPTVNLALTFAYNGQSFDVNVPNVPYARNYRTNILGRFFTDDAAFKVIVVPEFEKDDIIKPVE